MTTVAYDGRFLAADGRSTAGGMVTGKNVQKLFMLDLTANGTVVRGVFGGAGCFEVLLLVKQYLENNDLFEAELVPEIEPETFQGLIVLETGEVYGLEHKLVPMPQETPCSIGSGSPFALAAMASGKSASAAIEVAKQLDCYSGGNTRVFDTVGWNFVGDAIAA